MFNNPKEIPGFIKSRDAFKRTPMNEVIRASIIERHASPEELSSGLTPVVFDISYQRINEVSDEVLNEAMLTLRADEFLILHRVFRFSETDISK